MISERADADLDFKTTGLGDLEKASLHITGLNNALEIAGKIARVAKEGFDLAARGVADLVKTGEKWEDFRDQLTEFAGSAELGMKRYNELITFARDNRFDTTKVMEAALILERFQTDTQDTLQIVLDTAEATGTAYTDVAQAVGMAHMGMTKGLKQFGVESVADLTARFSGAAARQADDWGRLIAALKSRWDDFKRYIAESGVFDAVKLLVGNMLDALEGLSAGGKAEQLGKSIGQGIGHALLSATLLMAQAAQAITALAFDVGTFIARLGGGGVKSVGTGAAIGAAVGSAAALIVGQGAIPMGAGAIAGGAVGAGVAAGISEMGQAAGNLKVYGDVYSGDMVIGTRGKATPAAIAQDAKAATMAIFQTLIGAIQATITDYEAGRVGAAGGTAAGGAGFSRGAAGGGGAAAAEGALPFAAIPTSGIGRDLEPRGTWAIPDMTVDAAEKRIELLKGYTAEETLIMDGLGLSYQEYYASLSAGAEAGYRKAFEFGQLYRNREHALSKLQLKDLRTVMGEAYRGMIVDWIGAQSKKWMLQSMAESAEAIASLAMWDLAGAAKHAAAAVAFGALGGAAGMAAGAMAGGGQRERQLAGVEEAGTAGSTGAAGTRTIERGTGISAQNITFNLWIIHQGTTVYGDSEAFFQGEILPQLRDAVALQQV